MSIYKDLLTQQGTSSGTSAAMGGKNLSSEAQHLHHMLDQHLQSNSWVMFTATHGGAGSTRVVLELAQYLSEALAHGDQRVLLVDGNSQSPTLHHMLDGTNAMGLSELLITGRVEQILQRDVLPQVDFISNGTGHLMFPEAMFRTQDSTVMQLFSQYRYVLVDAPPLFSHPDALVLARLFSSVVLVTEYRKTKKDVLEEAKRRVEGAGGHVIGGVINKLQHSIPAWLYNRI